MATTEGPDGPASPTAPSEPQRRTRHPEFVGGLCAYTWGHLFRQYPGLLKPLRPWLHRELRGIFGEDPAQVLSVQEMILNALPVLGLHKEHLAEELQPDLGSHTTAFVQRLVDFTVRQCRSEAFHLFVHSTSPSVRGLEDSPGRVISATFARWRDRSPVARTRWSASQEREHGNVVTRTTRTGCQEGDRFFLLTSTRFTASQEQRERSPMASMSPLPPERGLLPLDSSLSSSP